MTERSGWWANWPPDKWDEWEGNEDFALIDEHLGDLRDRWNQWEDDEALREDVLAALFSRSASPASELFEYLIPQVLLNDDGSRRSFPQGKASPYGSSVAVGKALRHPSCPQEFIRMGARSVSIVYRYAALSNPACPEESQVEAWLIDNATP